MFFYCLCMYITSFLLGRWYLWHHNNFWLSIFHYIYSIRYERPICARIPNIWYLILKTPIRYDPDIQYLEPWSHVHWNHYTSSTASSAGRSAEVSTKGSSISDSGSGSSTTIGSGLTAISSYDRAPTQQLLILARQEHQARQWLKALDLCSSSVLNGGHSGYIGRENLSGMGIFRGYIRDIFKNQISESTFLLILNRISIRQYMHKLYKST